MGFQKRYQELFGDTDHLMGPAIPSFLRRILQPQEPPLMDMSGQNYTYLKDMVSALSVDELVKRAEADVVYCFGHSVSVTTRMDPKKWKVFYRVRFKTFGRQRQLSFSLDANCEREEVHMEITKRISGHVAEQVKTHLAETSPVYVPTGP